MRAHEPHPTPLVHIPPLAIASPTLRPAPTPTAFLSEWFAACPPDQFLELRAIRPGDHFVEQRFFTLDAIQDLYARACELVNDFDCYFGVCPRIRPRGTKADVTHAPGLWVDLDFKRFVDGEAGALRKLADFRLPPSWIVATGGGFHLYWLLTRVAQADASFEGRLKAIARMLEGDLAATDVCRVLRIPGTWHQTRDFQVKVIAWPMS